MNRCCRTCEWFKCGECTRDEMRNSLEEIIGEITVDMKEEVTNPMVLRIIDIVGDAIIERSADMNFIPPNLEFYCKYYE